MPGSRRVTRRTALGLGAAATALPWFHIRTAGAAGRLTVGLVDHWVPNSNEKIKQQIDSWDEKNKVEVNVDRITTVGAELQLTGIAESCKAGSPSPRSSLGRSWSWKVSSGRMA